MNNSEPFLSSKQLAKRCCVPLATLRQWRWFNKGPHFHKIGGQVLYYVKDIEAFEEKALRHHTTMTSNTPDKSA